MYTLVYKRHWATLNDNFDTLDDAMDEVARLEAANFEYAFPLEITDGTGAVVWDNAEIKRKMGFPLSHQKGHTP